MGFTINETINTNLHYKDITVITVAISEYIKLYKEKCDEEFIQRMVNLVDRLGNEMYNHPDNCDCKINTHAINDLIAQWIQDKDFYLRESNRLYHKMDNVNSLLYSEKARLLSKCIEQAKSTQ